MSMRKIAVAAAVAVALVASMLGPVATSSAASAPVRGAASMGSVVTGADLTWGVRQHQTFNDPRSNRKWWIVNQMRQTIQNTPYNEKIRIMTWNLDSHGIVDDLVRAHKRGVSVRLIMARELAEAQGYHGAFRRLYRGLQKGNAGRHWSMKSWARTCFHSCRGRGASMHSKFMISSRSGKHRMVVSQGSANFTTAAATRQWNDWYTVVGKPKLYKAYERVFNEAKIDRPAAYFEEWESNIGAWFAPFSHSDKVMHLLNKVRCWGARGAGVNGRTAIRIGQAVFQDARGVKIAKKLRQLRGIGCNIRVVFTMMPHRIRQILSNVPMRHLVYDWDGDGSYDRYLHMKAMTISGNWGGDPGHRVVLNGSANWSWTGGRSDEQGMVVHWPAVEKNYASWINHLFNTAPRFARPAPEYYESTGQKNPYAELELELTGQG